MQCTAPLPDVERSISKGTGLGDEGVGSVRNLMSKFVSYVSDDVKIRSNCFSGQPQQRARSIFADNMASGPLPSNKRCHALVSDCRKDSIAVDIASSTQAVAMIAAPRSVCSAISSTSAIMRWCASGESRSYFIQPNAAVQPERGFASRPLERVVMRFASHGTSMCSSRRTQVF